MEAQELILISGIPKWFKKWQDMYKNKTNKT